MKSITINVYSDAGHGWGQVKRTILEKYDLMDKISGYSYQWRGNVYLEEDLDLPRLVDVLRAEKVDVSFREFISHRPSKIRNYQVFDNLTKGN